MNQDGGAQKGILLPMALGLLVVVNLLLLTVTQLVTSDRRIAYNVIQNEQAVLAADAGIDWAAQLIASIVAAGDPPVDFHIPATQIMLEEEVGFRLSSLSEGLLAPGHMIECEGFCRSARKKYRVLLAYQPEEGTVTVVRYEMIYD